MIRKAFGPKPEMTVATELIDRIDPQLMVPNLQSGDRLGAIKELVDRMHEAGWVDDSLSFFW